jgi:serine/threonine protein kinase
MDLTGETIGSYKLLEKLQNDKPGMSDVYRAHDTLHNRNVAIKILSGALARNPAFIQRFQQEAQVLARLQHPSIVALYDTGTSANYDYLVMEYVSGGSLAGLIQREGPLPLERVLRITDAIAAALDYAHAPPFQLVHRDVKPANILLDEQGNPKLSDFGLVKVAEAHLTVVGQRFGTPAYMPPEQVYPAGDVGSPTNVGPWTDIYALGVVVYQMLSKQLPFRGSVQELLDAQLYQNPPSLLSIRPELPPLLDEVIQKALRKRSSERYASAGAFAAALRNAAYQAPHAQASAARPQSVTPLPPISQPQINYPAPSSQPSISQSQGFPAQNQFSSFNQPVTPPQRNRMLSILIGALVAMVVIAIVCLLVLLTLL